MTHLLPKLRCHYAEFLNQGSLKRLGILSLPTCVGLRYDHLIGSLGAFLGSVGLTTSLLIAQKMVITSRCLQLGLRIYLESPPTGLNQGVQHLDGLPFCVPPSLKRQPGGTGILTCFPSPTLLSLGLGSTNPERINLAQETLGLRRAGFSPALSLLVPA